MVERDVRSRRQARAHVGGGHAMIKADGSSIAEKLPPDPEGLRAGHRSRCDRDRQEYRSADVFAARCHPPAVEQEALQARRAFRAAARPFERKSTRLRAEPRTSTGGDCGIRRFPRAFADGALRHRRVPDDHTPPYPSTVARHKPAVASVIMAYFRGTGSRRAVAADRDADRGARAPNSAGAWLRGQPVPAVSYVGMVALTRTVNVSMPGSTAPARSFGPRQRHRRWRRPFIEVLRPQVALRDAVLRWAARRASRRYAADGMSGEGGARLLGWRDRIPLSQTDAIRAASRARSR